MDRSYYGCRHLGSTYSRRQAAMSCSSSTCVAPFHHTTGPSPCSAIEHFQNTSAANRMPSGTMVTHTNGIRRSLWLSLYLHTFRHLWGSGFVVIKLIRFDTYTDDFVSFDIHPFCDWSV